MNRLTYKAGFGSFSNETIVLGRVGEHLAQEIVFDCSAFAQLYGMGTAVLCARLPSGEKYPVPVAYELLEQSENLLRQWRSASYGQETEIF